MMTKLRTMFEAHGFDVISRISEKFGMRASKLRLFFIYLSFITLGSVFALYLTTAFFLWIKDSIFIKRRSVFDL
ncbi:MAG: PspC family transcriptional regulator [Flavobacteriaceae bacterium]|jgi:phage shock protein PspC (stress-responsive transcriptional regulator)|nr:PspC family transcriptional regulator [Flavobacteriaceae bacterium]MDR3273091.1 PspC family transcriptional regulator [Flavobacteriaceae bacterium]